MNNLISSRTRARLLAAFALLCSGAFVPASHAANSTWLNTGTTSANWSDATNWVGGTVPGSTVAITGINADTSIATFNTAVGTFGTSGSPILIDSASQNIRGITFDSSSVGAFTIGTTGGNSLYLTTGGTIQMATSGIANNQVINAPLVIEGAGGTYSILNNSTGAGTLTIGGSITGGNAGATVLTLGGTNTGANTISGAIGNGTATSVALTKTGVGSWTLSGANTYTGATNLSGGSVTLDYGTNNNSKIGGVLTLSGVNLTLSGGSTAQTVTSTTLNNGATKISQPSGSSTLALGAITRNGANQTANLGTPSNSGATLAISADNVVSTTSGTASSVLTSAVGTGTAYAVVGGNTWAAKAASGNNIVGLTTAGLSYTANTGTTVSGHADITSNVTLAAAGTANTLRFNTAAATTLTATGQTLTLNNGGILVTSAVGNNLSTISGGTLSAGTGLELVIFQNNTANGLTISSVIANNGSSKTDLIKSGDGLLTLSGSNTYTGRTFINGGTLSISSVNNIAPQVTQQTDQLSFNGGTLQITAAIGDLGSNRRTSLYANGGTIETTSGASATLSANIGGNGATTGSLTKTGLGTLTVSGTGNSFTGGVIVNAGTLSATGATGTSLGATTGTLTVNNTNTGTGSATVLNLQTGVDTTMGTLSGTVSQTGVTSGTNTATINNGGAGKTFTVNQTGDSTYAGVIAGGGNLALGSLSTSKLTLSGVNTYSGSTTITAGTLSIGGAGQLGSGAYAGNIANSSSLIFNSSANQTLSGVVSGTGTFTQSGAGTTNLTNTNTYTGATTITGGKLVVDGVINSGSAIAITQGTLGGTGTVGSVTVANNIASIVQNGASGGVFTIGSLNFAGAGTLNIFDNSVSSSRVLVTNALSTSGTVTVTGSGTWTNGVNNLLTYGSFSGSVGNFTLGTISGLTSRQSLGALSLAANTLSLTINGDSPKWTGLDNGNWVVGTTGASSNWKLITGGSATDYISGDVVLFDDTASSGAVTISAANVSPSSTTFNNSTTSYTLSSGGGFGIAGSGSLTKNGTASLGIDTANTYTGGTVINGGTVTIGVAGTLGASTGALAVNNTNTGAGTDVVLNLSTGLDITTGSLSGAIATPSSGTNTVTINTASGRTFTVNQTTAGTFAGNIAGAGGFTLGSSSTAILTLSGSNTYTGNTIINAGTLKLGSASALTSAALVGGAALSGAGSLDINGNSLVFTGLPALTGGITSSSGTPTVELNLGANATYASTFAGSLGLTKSGAGTLTLSGGAANTYSGLTTINGGQVTLNKTTGVNAIGGNVQINSGTTLFIGSIGGNQITDTSTVTVNSGGSYAMNFQPETIGNIDVNGGTVSSGSSATNNGALTIAGAGTTTVRNGGTLLMGNMTTGTGGVTLGDGATLTTTSGPTAIIRLNSNVTYNGTTTGATLGADTGMGGSTFALNAVRTFTIADGAATTDLTLTGVIANGTGTGGIIKSGLGTMLMTGVSTYTGGTTINAGTLQLGVANAIAATSAITLGGGTLNLGGFSQAAFTNALTLSGSSTLDFGSHVTGLTLTFADSSATTWTGTLSLLDFSVGTDNLSFTSIAGLTVAQLGEISLAGYTATGLDSSGFVQFSAIAVPEPSTFAALAGLLALGFVAYRRRRA